MSRKRVGPLFSPSARTRLCFVGVSLQAGDDPSTGHQGEIQILDAHQVAGV